MPKISGKSSPTVQKSALNLRQGYAPRAEICPESQARLCTLGRNMPQISGTFMHPGQKYAPNLRHVYAPRAEVCPESGARLYTPGRNMS